MGLKILATLSDGVSLTRENLTRTFEVKLATAQRARKKKQVTRMGGVKRQGLYLYTNKHQANSAARCTVAASRAFSTCLVTPRSFSLVRALCSPSTSGARISTWAAVHKP